MMSTLFFVILLSPLLAQNIQNPFWTLPSPVSSSGVPLMVKNGVLASAGQVVNLPFTTPPLGGLGTGVGYPFFAARRTAANGIFDECGDPIFYVVHDDVFNDQGIAQGNLILKDRWIKWDDPAVNFDNASPQSPAYTENFEAPVVEMPGDSSKYLLVYSNCGLFGSEIWIATYDANTQTLTQEFDPTMSSPSYSTGSYQFRMAISKPTGNGGRNIFIVDTGNELGYIPISGTGVIQSSVTLQGSLGGAGDLAPELELSHDGRTLAWAVHINNTAIIHFYNLVSSQHTTFEVAPGACQKISGLEFLANGRLAISAVWNSPYDVYDGVVVFNTALNGLNFVSNSSSYHRAMIELGVGKNWLYANRGNQIAAINTGNFTISSGYSISVNSFSLTSPFASAYSSVSGALPDQIDGEFYVNPLFCDPPDDPSPLRVGRVPVSELPLDFSFEPVIKHTSRR